MIEPRKRPYYSLIPFRHAIASGTQQPVNLIRRLRPSSVDRIFMVREFFDPLIFKTEWIVFQQDILNIIHPYGFESMPEIPPGIIPENNACFSKLGRLR